MIDGENGMRVLYLVASGVVLFDCFWQQISSLLDHGSSVDIIIDGNGKITEDMLPEKHESVNVTILSNNAVDERRNNSNRCVWVNWFKPVLKPMYRNLRRLLFAFSLRKIDNYDVYLKKKYMDRYYAMNVVDAYDYVIACDEISLFRAYALLEEAVEKKLIYHSYELYWETFLNPKKNTNADEYVLYSRCCDILKKVYMIVIQDEDRWKSLCRSTGVDSGSVHFLWPITERNRTFDINYLDEDTLPLRTRSTSVIYVTSILRRREVLTLAREFAKIENATLIVHGAIGEYETISELRHISEKYENIEFSDKYLSYDGVVDIVEQSAIVFLYYSDEDDNNLYIGHSSNKLALALERGKPLIVAGNRVLKQLCEESMCGVFIEHIRDDELMRAIRAIESDYFMYSRNARALYLKEYDSKIYVEQFCSML